MKNFAIKDCIILLLYRIAYIIQPNVTPEFPVCNLALTCFEKSVILHRPCREYYSTKTILNNCLQATHKEGGGRFRFRSGRYAVSKHRFRSLCLHNCTSSLLPP